MKRHAAHTYADCPEPKKHHLASHRKKYTAPKTETPISLKNKHETAGHDVTVDANGGVLFCVTCGHHILSNAQIMAGTFCDFLDLVLMGNSEFETLEKNAEAIMHSIDPTRYVTLGDK